jgi:hypothetical protein
MKVKIIVYLLIILVLISGCGKNQITASAIKDLPIEKQVEIEANVVSAEACADVVCNSNSKCINGDCVCNDGYKKCDGQCILEIQCCKDSECGEYESCKGTQCATDNCGVNAVFDIAKGRCECNTESKYCPAQKSCIPKSNCCMSSYCDSDERCVDTKYLAVICIEKQCKSISLDRGESFLMEGVRYEVDITSFLQNNGVDLTVNDVPMILRGDQEKSIGDNIGIHLESIESAGGNCKSDE